MRAVAYLRVSTLEQAADDKVSLEAQEQDIRDYCERKGYQLTQVYRDAGYSGASKNRPEFQQMLRDLPSGGVDIILCWRGDRIARGLRPTVALKDALEGTDIEIEASNDFINRRWLSLRAAMAEEELEAIRERARMGHRGRAGKGKIINAPYGYAIGEDGRPVIVEDQAEDVRGIYAMYLNDPNASYETIARAMNEQGKRTRRKNRWVKQDVGLILTNPAYTGKGQWGKRRRYWKDNGAGKDVSHIKEQPEEAWLAIEFPPIISEDTFNEAQRRRQHYTIQRVGRMETLSYPFKGILWCGQHARPYTASYTANKGDKSVYRYYECPLGSRHHRDHGRCAQPKPSASKLEDRVVMWVIDWLTDEAKFRKLRDDYEARLKRGGGVEAMERAEKELDRLQEEEDRLLSDFARKHFDPAKIELFVKGVREQQEYHREIYNRARAESADLIATLEMLDQFSEETRDNKYLDHLLGIGMKEVSRRILKRVTVTDRPYPDDLECLVNLSELAELLNTPRGICRQRNSPDVLIGLFIWPVSKDSTTAAGVSLAALLAPATPGE